MRAFDVATQAPWAIMPETLQTILDIAARANEGPEVLEAKLGRKLQNTRTVTVRDGVAVVPVVGPLFRYANMFTEISGATSTEILARDITTAIEDPAITAVVLEIDSPGGEATGINELAKLIAEGAKKKPVVAYGGGMVASGAYWLATAASEIVADETAMLGSIGVVFTMRKRGDDAGRVEIVSAQSPKKRLDVGQESGRSEVQRIADDFAAVFVRAVATNRGVTEEKVLEEFGKGSVLLTEAAVTAGMADRVGTLESVIAELRQRAAESPSGLRSAATKSRGGDPMSEKTKPAAETTSPETIAAAAAVDVAAVQAAAAAEARKAERARVTAIIGCEEAKGREELANHLASETEMTVEQAKATLSKAPKASATTNPLADAMSRVNNPEVGADADADEDTKTLHFINNVLKKGA